MNVIELLNEARSRELTVIIQYMAQHYRLESSGYGKLALKIKNIAIQEMKHAESLAERILFLGGVPTTKPDAPANQQQEISEMLQTDIGLEQQAIEMYNRAAQESGLQGDHVSATLFARLAEEEEDHLDEFQNAAAHLARLGAAYLATLTD
ncbi:MAG: bacterioferritin [Chloroflexi bacterium]|nr:bacterioferritin [Chloroflexota bacterium]